MSTPRALTDGRGPCCAARREGLRLGGPSGSERRRPNCPQNRRPRTRWWIALSSPLSSTHLTCYHFNFPSRHIKRCVAVSRLVTQAWSASSPPDFSRCARRAPYLCVVRSRCAPPNRSRSTSTHASSAVTPSLSAKKTPAMISPYFLPLVTLLLSLATAACAGALAAADVPARLGAHHRFAKRSASLQPSRRQLGGRGGPGGGNQRGGGFGGRVGGSSNKPNGGGRSSAAATKSPAAAKTTTSSKAAATTSSSSSSSSSTYSGKATYFCTSAARCLAPSLPRTR